MRYKITKIIFITFFILICFTRQSSALRPASNKTSPYPVSAIPAQRQELLDAIEWKDFWAKRFVTPNYSEVYVSLTNYCNGNCAICVSDSIPIKQRKENPSHKLEFSEQRLDAFIRFLNESGIRKICFTGGGEPFSSDRAVEMIWRIIKETNIEYFTFITNGIWAADIKNGRKVLAKINSAIKKRSKKQKAEKAKKVKSIDFIFSVDGYHPPASAKGAANVFSEYINKNKALFLRGKVNSSLRIGAVAGEDTEQRINLFIDTLRQRADLKEIVVDYPSEEEQQEKGVMWPTLCAEKKNGEKLFFFMRIQPVHMTERIRRLFYENPQEYLNITEFMNPDTFDFNLTMATSGFLQRDLMHYMYVDADGSVGLEFKRHGSFAFSSGNVAEGFGAVKEREVKDPILWILRTHGTAKLMDILLEIDSRCFDQIDKRFNAYDALEQILSDENIRTKAAILVLRKHFWRDLTDESKRKIEAMEAGISLPQTNPEHRYMPDYFYTLPQEIIYQSALRPASSKNLGNMLKFQRKATALRREDFNQAISGSLPAWMQHYNLGVGFYRDNKFFEALRELKFALEVSPMNIMVRYALGCLYYDMNELKLAEKTLTPIRGMATEDTFTKSRALCALARIIMEYNDRFDEAEELALEAINIDLNAATAFHALAEALFFQQKHKESNVAFEMARNIDPDYGIGRGSLSRNNRLLEILQNRVMRNVEAIRSSALRPVASVKTPDMHYEITKSDPKNIYYFPQKTDLPFQNEFDKALEYAQSGNFASAERVYFELTRKLPGSSLAWYGYGYCLHRQGKNREAVFPLEKAHQLDRFCKYSMVALAGVYSKLGNLDSAIFLMKHAARINSKDGLLEARAYCLYGIILKKQRNYQQATDMFEKALVYNVDFINKICFTRLGDINKVLGNKAEAEKLYREAVAIITFNEALEAEAFNKLGVLLFIEGNFKEAEQMLSAAYKIHHSSIMVLDLINALIANGKMVSAVNVMDEFLESNQDENMTEMREWVSEEIDFQKEQVLQKVDQSA